MPEGAVAEAPIAAPAASSESVSSGISDSQVSTSSTQGTTEQVEHSAETGSEGEVVDGQKAGRLDINSILRDPAKKEALKAIDPALIGVLRDAQFGSQQLKKEFPGGIKEALQYRDAIKQYGGAEGIRESMEYAKGYDELDSFYVNEPDKFIQKISQNDPEAFERAMTPAIEHFAKTSPEMYQHVMSKVLVNTLNSAQFPEMLQQIYSKTESPEAKQLLEQVWDKIEGYKKLAQNIPEKKVNPEFEKLEREKTAWQQQKRQDMEKSINGRSTQHRDNLIAREIKSYADWGTLDEDRKEAVVREVKARTAKIANSDPDFRRQRDRYLENGDSEGAAKLERDFLDTHIPQIAPKVAKLFWSNPVKQVQKTDKPGTNGTKPADKGFQLLKSAPDSNKIDKRATTRDMVMANKAVLIGGQKVQWA